MQISPTQMRLLLCSHLGKNPLACDCNLRWLADYLELNPVETSQASCASPSRNQGKKLSELSESEFKCSGKFRIFWNRRESSFFACFESNKIEEKGSFIIGENEQLIGEREGKKERKKEKKLIVPEERIRERNDKLLVR